MFRTWTRWALAVAVTAAPLAASEALQRPGPGGWGWTLMVGCLGLACAGCIALAWLTRLHHRRLVDSRAHYRHLVDLAEGYVAFRINLGRGRAPDLELASRSIEKIAGHPPEYYQADPSRALRQVPQVERERVLAAVRTAAQEGVPLRLNLTLEHPRFGKPRHVMVHAVPVADGENQIWDGICVDLTTEAEAEEERRNLTQQLELARRHESLGLLAGGVAHDFNNLLGAIRGNAELILPTLISDKVAGHRMNRLMMAVDRATGLVRQILAYTGKGAIEIKAVQLEQEVRGLKTLLKHSMPNQARIALEVEHGLPPVMIDPVQFQQVLLNLVVNAAESYSAAGGTVSIVLKRDGLRVRLEVSDQGAGMDEATKARMFEPYFTTKRNGHGLGLAAVKGIVDKFGGQLGCRSAPGFGTTFIITFESTSPHVTTVRVNTPMPDRTLPRAILVIDDEELVRDTTVAMLQGMGYATEDASGGAEGLKLLLQRRDDFAAAVIDCRMKDLDGQALLKQIRAGGDRLPVVLVSGMIGSDGLTEELRDKRTRFLPKPFSQQQLANAIAAVAGPKILESSTQAKAVRIEADEGSSSPLRQRTPLA